MMRLMPIILLLMCAVDPVCSLFHDVLVSLHKWQHWLTRRFASAHGNKPRGRPKCSSGLGKTGGFVLAEYDAMRDDTPRTRAYEAAIAVHAAGRTVLDLGTGSLALLSLAAARAGAAHVYAVDSTACVVESARRAVAAAGFSDRITVVHGVSTNITPAQLSQHGRPDLLVHEVLGPLAGSEGACASVRDARRLLVPPSHGRRHGHLVRSIPAWAHSLLVPSTLEPSADLADAVANEVNKGERKGSINLSGEDTIGNKSEWSMLAPPLPFETLAFEALAPQALQDVTLRFNMTKGGVLRSLATFIEFAATHDVPQPYSSLPQSSHWRKHLLPIGTAAAVAPGDVLTVRARCFLETVQVPLYVLDLWLKAAAATAGRVLRLGRLRLEGTQVLWWDFHPRLPTTLQPWLKYEEL